MDTHQTHTHHTNQAHTHHTYQAHTQIHNTNQTTHKHSSGKQATKVCTTNTRDKDNTSARYGQHKREVWTTHCTRAIRRVLCSRGGGEKGRRRRGGAGGGGEEQEEEGKSRLHICHTHVFVRVQCSVCGEDKTKGGERKETGGEEWGRRGEEEGKSRRRSKYPKMAKQKSAHRRREA